MKISTSLTRWANISNDKSSKNPIMNGVAINLNVLSVLMKGGIFHDEDDDLIVIMY